MNTAVKLENLTIGYEKKVIAADICESLPKGELTCLLGPNGAGKTTLMRTVIGFLPPIAGTVEIAGQDLNAISPREMARLVSVVLTERPDLQNMTVRELAAMGRSPYTGFFGRLSREDLEITDHALALTGALKFADRRASTLSDGERQKTMIAKALAQQTPLILLDEPTAFLDYPSKVEIMTLLRRICHEEGTTVLLSTHDLEIALQTADRLWLMDREHGVRTGTVASLAADGSIATYFDSPLLSFLRSDLRFLVKK